VRALHLPRLQPHGGVRAPGELPAHVRHLRARDPPESAGVHLRQPSRGRDARAQKETGADGPDEEAEPGAAADGPSDYPPSAAPTLAPTLPDDAKTLLFSGLLLIFIFPFAIYFLLLIPHASFHLISCSPRPSESYAPSKLQFYPLAGSTLEALIQRRWNLLRQLEVHTCAHQRSCATRAVLPRRLS